MSYTSRVLCRKCFRWVSKNEPCHKCKNNEIWKWEKVRRSNKNVKTTEGL
jgi:hypothetical protein